MNTCDYQKYYSEYISGELPPDLDLEFYRHLMHCQVCEQEIERFYQVYRQLRSRRRPAPDAGLIKGYHRHLRSSFKASFSRMSPREFIHELIFTHSRAVRFAEVFLVLLAGILIGWFFFYDTGPSQMSVTATPEYHGKPISKQDIEYLNYYFLASEIVLLEMMNGELEEDDFVLEKETAQKLLIKTFRVHEVALRMKDPKILRFLTRMELILYELSNTDQDQLAETLASVRYIIDEAQLLGEVRELKQLIENAGTPASMPG